MKVKIKPCKREFLQKYYDDCDRFGIHSDIKNFVGKLLCGPVEIDRITHMGTIIVNGYGMCNKKYVNIVKERTENA